MKKTLVLKRLFTAALSLVLATSLAACGGNQSSSSSAAAGTALTGKVALNGSTSMEKVIGALSEAFMQQNSGVDVTYDPTGSGAGITAVTEGRADIGLSSRALKDSEAGLSGTVFAMDGIAIIVNTANPVKDLTVEQIGKIAKGEITNWKDVGGNDAPFVMIGREAGSGTRDGFETITGTKDEAKYAQELPATGAVISAVQANENAIGYASLASVKETVTTLLVGGIAPSEATVLDGSYTVQRPFVLVTKGGTEQSPAAKAFMEFALANENAEIITNAGAVPLRK